MRDTLTRLPDLGFILDKDGRYLDVMGYEMGYEESERYERSKKLIGKRVHDVMPQIDADRFMETIDRVFDTGTLEVLAYPLNVVDGLRWFEGRVSIAPRALTDSKAVLWLSVDITDRKLAEESLQEDNARLKSQLVQKSADLEDVEVRAQLQDRLAAVGQLAAGIAHDFNNMLTVMMGFSELVAMAPDVPESEKIRLKKVHEEGQLAVQLIRQILDFSRQTKIDSRPLDMVNSVEEAVKFLSQAMPETIRLRVEIEDPDCVVKSDSTQLRQIIANLVLNARDAIEGEGEILIKLSQLLIKAGDRLIIESSTSTIVPQVEAGEWVVLTVSDTGSGIPPDVMNHIFEPFFSTKAPGKGTGLGLSQVYGIVKQQGGYVEVQSKTGEGTVITIYLKKESAEVTPYAVDEEGVVKGKGELILLVEDRESVLQTVRMMLEELGYSVVISHNGKEALEIFSSRGQEISAVVTDVIMPEMGGGQLATELRSRVSGFPIVMMTGHQLSEEEEMTMIPGTVELLRKPLLLADLGLAIRRSLRPKQK